MRTSARNHLWGKISRIHEGLVNAEVILDMGTGKSITAVVTRESVKSLGLELGTSACAVFQASTVILGLVN